MQTKVKSKKVAEIMARVNGRAAMGEKLVDDALRHIALWLDRQPDGTTLGQMFDRFQTDEDLEYLSDAELFAMLEEGLGIPLNQQLRRLVLSAFDKGGDGRVSRREFCERLAPYTEKAAITVEDVGFAAGVVPQKDQEELVAMRNEAVRPKAVYEELAFDATAEEVLARREAETIALLKAGELPVLPIKGAITVRAERVLGLPTVAGRPHCFLLLSRHRYDLPGKEGTRQPGKAVPRWCREAFQRDGDDPKNATVATKLTPFNGGDEFGANLHAWGDTMTLAFYLAEEVEKAPVGRSADRAEHLSFVGEAAFPWKHCLLEENVGRWVAVGPVFLSEGSDPRRPLASKEALSGQLFLKVRYLPAGAEGSRLNPDGSKQAKANPYGELAAKADPHDRSALRAGAAGTLCCAAKSWTYPAGVAPEAGASYAVKCAYTGREDHGQTEAGGKAGEEKKTGKPAWTWSGLSTSLAVNDTENDLSLTVWVVKVTGEGDAAVEEAVATGAVPASAITAAYESTKRTGPPGFTVDLNEGGGLAIRLSFSKELLEAK